MKNTTILNLLKCACLLTLFLFYIDRNEFQGDYALAAFEFVMMSMIIAVLFLVGYGAILLVQRFVTNKA